MVNDILRFQQDKENALREFIYIVFERKRIVLSIFIPVFLCSAILAVLLPSIYRSTAKFSIFVPQAIDPLQQERSYDYKNLARRVLEEQKQLVLSTRVLQKVVGKTLPDLEPASVPKRVEEIRKEVEVTPPAGESFEETSVFYVSYKGNDPLMVTEMVRTIADSYLEAYNELYKSRTSYSFDFFKDQTAALHADMMEKEKILRDYERQKAAALVDILNLETSGGSPEVGPASLLTQFTRKYYELQEELAGVNVAIEGLQVEEKSTSIPAVPTEMDQAGRTIAIYKNKVAMLQILMNEMKSQFTGQFGPVKQAEKEISLTVDSMKQELARTIRAQKMNAEAIAARLQELEKTIRFLKDRITSTIEERSEYEQKRQQYQLAKDAYVNVRNQMEQARLAHSLNSSKQRLTLVDEPSVPGAPFKPDRPAIFILGFLAGIFLGVAAAVTVDYFDHTIKKPQDIERYLNVPMLGSIPKVG
ncbi:MAG TPA: GNVR domain-containing protein [Syntrophobacteraceae bacterium]|nr:GNVR domain-containing protein [Syntrophobacteraceae bacterium]